MSCDIRHIDSYLVVHKPSTCSSAHSPSLIIQITLQETDSIRLVEKVKQGSSADATTNDCYPDRHDIYARLLSTYYQLFFPTISYPYTFISTTLYDTLAVILLPSFNQFHQFFN